MASVAMEELRKRMREKFPQAHTICEEREDEQGERGTLFDAKMFPVGTVSEVVPAGRFYGMSLMVAALLEDEG